MPPGCWWGTCTCMHHLHALRARRHPSLATSVRPPPPPGQPDAPTHVSLSASSHTRLRRPASPPLTLHPQPPYACLWPGEQAAPGGSSDAASDDRDPSGQPVVPHKGLRLKGISKYENVFPGPAYTLEYMESVRPTHLPVVTVRGQPRGRGGGGGVLRAVQHLAMEEGGRGVWPVNTRLLVNACC